MDTILYNSFSPIQNIPCRVHWRPIISAAREPVQALYPEYQLVKILPFQASWSKLGGARRRTTRKSHISVTKIIHNEDDKVRMVRLRRPRRKNIMWQDEPPSKLPVREVLNHMVTRTLPFNYAHAHSVTRVLHSGKINWNDPNPKSRPIVSD
jgi:hypothetical protein